MKVFDLQGTPSCLQLLLSGFELSILGLLLQRWSHEWRRFHEDQLIAARCLFLRLDHRPWCGEYDVGTICQWLLRYRPIHHLVSWPRLRNLCVLLHRSSHPLNRIESNSIINWCKLISIYELVRIGFKRLLSYRHRFRIHGSNNPKIFGNTMEKKTSHPQVVTHCDAFAWTNLELPLRKKFQLFYMRLISIK